MASKKNSLTGEINISNAKEVKDLFDGHFITYQKLLTYLGGMCLGLCGLYMFITPMIVKDQLSDVRDSINTLDQKLVILKKEVPSSSHTIKSKNESITSPLQDRVQTFQNSKEGIKIHSQ